MFGLQPTHLIIILVVALLIFGPARLPEIGRTFGKTLREFQAATKEATDSLTQELQKPVESAPAQPKPAETKPEVASAEAKPAETTVGEAKTA